jgi:hypothetical protein
MVDERIFASRGVFPMLSGIGHPAPELPTIGIEVDTGNCFSYNNGNNSWAAIGGNLIGYAAGPLGDVAGWMDQATVSFTLVSPMTIAALSDIIGTQVTQSSLAHVNRVTVDGTTFECGRDRNVPQNDPSAISGHWIGVLSAGNHTITNTAYATPASGSWRLSKAALMVFGF